MDPPGAMVLTQKGTEVSTEFSLLTKDEEVDQIFKLMRGDIAETELP